MPLFNLTILSSDRKIYDGEVQSLIVPGAAGYFGVLANHAPFISNLSPGVITLHEPSGATKTYESQSGGYFGVVKNKAMLLLDKDIKRELH